MEISAQYPIGMQANASFPPLMKEIILRVVSGKKRGFANGSRSGRACHIVRLGDVDGPFGFRVAGAVRVAKRSDGSRGAGGPARSLVLNVCRSVLSDSNDADDAFQATFLVLARKAASIRGGDSLASWLCRVAYRIAVRAGTESARRRQVERRGAEQYAGRIASENAERPGSDEIAILFDELDRLPERYRIPVVLCHLEGLSTDAAARRLGCPVGTIWARLSRARARLRSRLVRRGVSLSVAGLAAAVFPTPMHAAIAPNCSRRPSEAR